MLLIIGGGPVGKGCTFGVGEGDVEGLAGLCGSRTVEVMKVGDVTGGCPSEERENKSRGKK